MLRTLSSVFFVVGMFMLGGMASAVTAGHDGAGPDVSITSGFESKSAQYTLTGQVGDSSPITHLSYSVNEGPAHSLSPAGKFKASITLKPGQSNILVKAVDKAGRKSSAMIVINYEMPMGSEALASGAKGKASLRKLLEERMHAMREELAKEAPPPATQSAAESVKALNNSVANLKKTLASLGASTVPVPEQGESGSSASNKKPPPEKYVDTTAPLIEITSPANTISTNYTLAGTATDDTSVSSLSFKLNGEKSRALKLNHGRFQTPLVLKQGENFVRVEASDGAGHEAVQDLHVVVNHPTSAQLIDAAVAKGKLDKNKALMYKVFAAFGDPRLPEKYGSQRGEGPDNHILDKVAARLPSLPRSIQKKLIPFFMPPYYKGSWFDRALDHTAGMASASVGASFRNRGEVHIEPAVIRHYPNPVSQAYPTESFKALLVSGPGQIPLPGGNEPPGYSKSGWGMPPCLTMRTSGFHFVNCHISFKWRHVDGKHVRVWYLNKLYKSDEVQPDTNDWKAFKGPAKYQAEEVRDQAEDVIWPKLTKLMGRKPLSDADVPLNGGDGRLDIALTPGLLENKATYLGLTIPYLSYSDRFWGKDCKPNPVYIELRRTLPLGTLLSDLSHEMMHSIQWTYHTKGCLSGYNWLMESTAVWAQDYVYPKINWEHQLAAGFLKHPQIPLETVGGNHEYWSYLFFFYLRWHLKSAEIVRKTWEATRKEPTGIQAVAAAIKTYKSNMEKMFPLFAVTDLNGGPIDSYIHWDGINAHASYKWTDVHLGSDGDISLPFLAKGKGLDHLTARYFVFSFKGVPARSVAVFNGYSYKLSRIVRREAGIVGSPSQSRMASADVWGINALPPKDRKGRHLQALVNIGGKWQKNHKNGKPYINVGTGKVFCASSPDKRINGLILVASNSRMPGKGNVLAPRGKPPLVYASNMGCGPWKGTVESNDNGPSSIVGEWTFVMHFKTGAPQPGLLPIETEGQFKKAFANGSASPSPWSSGNSGLGELLSGAASPGSSEVSAWPTKAKLIQPFGEVLSFGTGETTWTARYKNCGSTKGKYKNLVAIMTYNFVRSGDLYRHYMLVSIPAPAMSFSLSQLSSNPKAGFSLPYRVWDPSSHTCDVEHRTGPPDQPFIGTMSRDGIHAQGSVRGDNYEAGDGSANYYFHLESGPGKG